ncbi:EAL domain-containing protein [Pseudomonas sp. NPDC088444]|uniref:bifunctional diguanylate cyclase/phosphodiesterase n=1 Tax=Pseudomonas sp. NPDC088444 TaxID=3364456 RepID=UPI00384EC9C9
MSSPNSQPDSKNPTLGERASSVRRGSRLHSADPLDLLKLGIPVLAVVLVILMGLSYQDAQKQAASDIRNLNLALESQLNASFIDQLQIALDGLTLSVSAQDIAEEKSYEADSAVRQIIRQHPTMSFLITDRDGHVKFRSGELADSSLDRTNMVRPTPSEGKAGCQPNPVFYGVAGAADNVLSASMPLLDKQQRVAGRVTANLPLALIKKQLDEFDVGKHGVITLRNTNPVDIILRSPNDLRSTQDYEPDLIDQLVDAGEREGVLVMSSRVDGAERLYGFRRIGQSSLVLVVGLAPKDYLEEWRYNVLLTIGFALILLVVMGISIHQLRRHRSNKTLAASQLRAHEARTRLLVDSVGQPIFCLDVEGRCNYLNKAAARLFGVEQSQLPCKDRLESFFNSRIEGALDNFTSRVIKTVSNNEVCYFESSWLDLPGRGVVPIEIHGYAHHVDECFVGAVLTVQDISERQQHESQISFLAYHDALTQLPNRLFIRKRFEELAERSEQLALLYLDVDHFKLINDSLGHVRGDELLCTIARRLATLPRVDTVARLGGDEFLLLVRDTSRPVIEQLTASISRTVSEFCEVDDYQLTITPSIGIALFPEHGANFDELMKASDIGLYQAKAAGRNTWKFYEHEMGLRELRRLELQVDLRAAWSRRELTVHYQPQVDLATGEIIGVEALLRWFHPTMGTIAPSEFIPAAEHCGLIIPISRWLIRHVCNQAMIWKSKGLGERIVAVNCSAVQFHQGDLVRDVGDVLRETGLAPGFLELEITESILIEDTPRVMATIAELKALGVRLSIDDFGTGYSSMAYLKRFAVDKLKIDQSFVRGMLVNQQDAAIVKSVIGLAHTLQMKATAEGVETLDIVDALSAAGCDEAQGYYYARPCSPQDLEALLVNRVL